MKAYCLVVVLLTLLGITSLVESGEWFQETESNRAFYVYTVGSISELNIQKTRYKREVEEFHLHEIRYKREAEHNENHPARFRRQGEEPAPAPDAPAPEVPSPDSGQPAGPEQGTMFEKVGPWIDTVGDWMTKANTAIQPLNGIANTAVNIMKMMHDMKKAKFEQHMAELNYNLKIEDLCSKICALEWSNWSQCTTRCGGGTRFRTRQLVNPGSCQTLKHFSCPHTTNSSEMCNTDCANGGRPYLRGGCECPHGFSGECCDNEVVCPFPGKPPFGTIEGEFPAKYGTMVTFSCQSGYALQGHDQSYCSAAGRWTSPRPNCVLVKCTRPPIPEHGSLLNSPQTYRVDEEVNYMCEPGYILVGPAKRRCISWGEGAGRWTGFDPICQEVTCDIPVDPLHGRRVGLDFKLHGKVQFECNAGFRLKGSTVRTCLPNGKWSGHEATCEKIMCEAPEAPKFGQIRGIRSEYSYGSRVLYECDSGYQLSGDRILRCVEDKEWGVFTKGGKWDKEMPKCVGASCEPLDVLENGVKDGSVYSFPYNVTFSCFAGYALHGIRLLKCERNGQWNADTPTCQECPVDHYRTAGSTDVCIPCPAHTHTTSSASTSPLHCVCDEGFTGDSQTSCQEVRCPMLEEPLHGRVSDCGDRLDDVCDISCDDGYVLEGGSAQRVCTESEEWTGSQPTCKACPLNTYKADERSCLPCPLHSKTKTEASSPGDCLCDEGFVSTVDGACQDINECDESPTVCGDVCRNTEGGYVCECSIPGYRVDPGDKRTCIQEKACRNLTEADAPKNGGLICHWYYEENSQQCRFGCNPGYTIPSMVNNYEQCGPVLNYEWTFEKRGVEIPDCIKEEYADIKVNANTTYFVRACRQLTPEEQDEVKTKFAKMLTDQGVCKKRNTQICSPENVGIICGATRRRRRRGVDEDVDEVDFKFKLKPMLLKESQMSNDKDVDCAIICPKFKIPPEHCDFLCLKTYRRFMQAAADVGKFTLEQAFKNRQNVHFVAAGRDFEPAEDANGEADLHVTEPAAECGDGAIDIGEGQCVPCAPGTFHFPMRKMCLPCRPGTYSSAPKQKRCLPCPAGTYSMQMASKECLPCPEDRYGENCAEKRFQRCLNGKTHPVTGECVCESGWEGDICEIDTDGCTPESCYPGVECRDIPAPGVGNLCGPCPHGMTGNGVECTSII